MAYQANLRGLNRKQTSTELSQKTDEKTEIEM